MSTSLSDVGIGTLFAMTLMAVACAAWFVAVAVSILSRKPQPKTGHRGADTIAILASIGFALTIGFAMRAATTAKKPKASEAPATKVAVSRGTCASLSLGMKAREVKGVMGEPDEIRSEEDVRGPKAEAWVYKASRCSVHVLAGKVDFID